MQRLTFRTLTLAAALALATPLMPVVAASAADDVVEWATTDGDPVEIATTSADQKAHVFFTGIAGRHLVVTCSRITENSSYVLQKADGTQIGDQHPCEAAQPTDINPLDAGGRYRLLLTAKDGKPFKATVEVWLVEDVTGTISPDGAPVTLAAAKPQQNLAFSVPLTAGQRVQLMCASNVYRNKMMLVDPHGSIIKEDLGSAAGCTYNSMGKGPLVTAKETGTYRFVLPQRRTTYNQTATASAVTVLPDVTTRIATGGTPSTVATTGAYQRVKATFTLSDRTTVYTTCTRKTDQPTAILLYDPNLAASEFGSCQPSGPGTEPTAFGSRTLGPGEWTIIVSPGGKTTDEFTLQIHTVPAPVTAQLPLDGTPVTLTTTAPGQIAKFTINADGGEDVYVGCRLATYRQPKPWILNAPANVFFAHPYQEGTERGCHTPGHDEYPSLFSTTELLRAGTHTLTVRMRLAETNSVTLWAYKIPRNVETTTAAIGTPVTVETTVPGQWAHARFPGVAGQKYTVSCDATGAPRHGHLMLSSPSDRSVDEPNSTFCGPTGSFTTAPLKESGDFRLGFDFAGDGVGKVTLKVTAAG